MFSINFLQPFDSGPTSSYLIAKPTQDRAQRRTVYHWRYSVREVKFYWFVSWDKFFGSHLWVRIFVVLSWSLDKTFIIYISTFTWMNETGHMIVRLGTYCGEPQISISFAQSSYIFWVQWVFSCMQKQKPKLMGQSRDTKKIVRFYCARDWDWLSNF